MPIDLATKRIVVTGGAGFVGQAVCRVLRERGCRDLQVPHSRDYDLIWPGDVLRMYQDMNPNVVIHLAAKVGGIGANRANPGRFFYDNMAMTMHLIEYARILEIDKFVQVGTVCSYPKITPIPFREDDLWNGYPESTNAPYGIAKRAALVMLDGYRTQYALRSAYVMPTNLYGPGDNFDLDSSHVIPALIRKCVEAIDRKSNSIDCWGSGTPSRDFLYVDDAADGIVRAAERMDEPVPINLGSGREITIIEIAELIARITGFDGELRWDTSKPDGQPRRRLDISRADRLLDWSPKMGLEDGLRRTVESYRQQMATV